MEIIDAVLLGLLQGLTEFIPVSSSGHLILLDEVTSVESSFAFDVLINIGTLLALIIYFRKRLYEIAKELIQQRNDKLARNVIISTIPAVIVGGLFTDLFSDDSLRNLEIVIIMSILVGILMIASDKMLKGDKNIDSINKKSAAAVGVAQALALIPGTSRSGSTILASRVFKLSYNQAAEYSFLIAIPILTGAILRSALEKETADLISDSPVAVIVGILTAFAAGMIAIHFMLEFLKRRGLFYFGVYRIILGLALILFIK